MNNLERLGNTLAKEMRKTVQGNKDLIMDLGRIVKVRRNGVWVLDLISDNLRQTIPQGSYSVLNGIALYDGDRVVVAWAGNEPVVLGRLVST